MVLLRFNIQYFSIQFPVLTTIYDIVTTSGPGTRVWLLQVALNPGPLHLTVTQNPFSILFTARMSHSVLDPGDICTSKYIITHVFSPLQLPGGDDHTIHNDHSLASAIAAVARLYSDHVGQALIPQWHSISQMLENLQAMSQSDGLDGFQAISQFNMDVGGGLSSLYSILGA